MLREKYFSTPKDSRPKIYAYTLPNVPTHNGYIKIGYTTRDAEERIRQQLGTAAIKHTTLFSVSAMRPDGTSFRDTDVHRVLEASHKPRMTDGREWFKCTVDDVKKAVEAVRNREATITEHTNTFPMRPEQEAAVTVTKEYFSNPKNPPKFLWNAKMRFGKTFTAYQLCKSMELKRILVLTFKPAAEDAWRGDIESHADFEGWKFISNKTAETSGFRIDDLYNFSDKSKPIVVFGSFQDLLGKNYNGGIKSKNEFIHETQWDIVIFDEYHFGAWRENAQGLFDFDEETDADPDEVSCDDTGSDDILPITAKYRLYLSGTPFRALNSGEFLEDQIFSWTYPDEQSAKENWEGENNPYWSMPRMVMMTYQLPSSIRKAAGQQGGYDFSLNEFFSADKNGFKHENYVKRWLMLIRGGEILRDEEDSELGKYRAYFPYGDSTLEKILRHTVWFLPDVASCVAMKKLLEEDSFFRGYKIVLCAGNECGNGADALEPLNAAVTDSPKETKTITLTCGKLLTGVTVRAWTGIFMLRNLKSPETYFQAAFRVQSPWTEYDDDEGREVAIKQDCYVFDFSPERALKQVADYSCRLNINETDPEKKAGEFIKFLPILAFDGASMIELNAKDVLEFAMSGTTGVLLARKWKSPLLINLNLDTLSRLHDDDEAMEAIRKITSYRAVKNDVEKIINLTKEINSKKKGDNPDDKPKISEEEKELRKELKEFRDKLMKFLSRIPLFMYLTDEREKTILDIVNRIDPQLFEEVTGITVQEFRHINELGLFNAELINEAIYSFKRYEDTSLEYTGLSFNETDVYGGFDETKRREEIYEEF